MLFLQKYSEEEEKDKQKRKFFLLSQHKAVTKKLCNGDSFCFNPSFSSTNECVETTSCMNGEHVLTNIVLRIKNLAVRV